MGAYCCKASGQSRVEILLSCIIRIIGRGMVILPCLCPKRAFINLSDTASCKSKVFLVRLFSARPFLLELPPDHSNESLLPIRSSPLPVRRVSVRPAIDTLFLRSSESRFFDTGAFKVKTFQVAVCSPLRSIRFSLSVFLTSSACPLTRNGRDLKRESGSEAILSLFVALNFRVEGR